MNQSAVYEKIDRYFNAWLIQDKEGFLASLHKNILVKECTGDVYSTKATCEKWFEGWNVVGNKVLGWDISSRYFDQDNQVAIVEWKFDCLYENNLFSFLGTSIVAFKDELIIKLSEYQMNIEERYPY